MKSYNTYKMDSTIADKTIKHWKLDINHTGLHFRVGHLGLAEVRGSFTDYAGLVETVGDRFDSAKVAMVIKAESVNTANILRDTHLRSADFFDTDNFPEIKFFSSCFQALGEDKYLLTGGLTIKGISKEIAFHVVFKGFTEDMFGNEVAIFTATSEINRLDYDLVWHPILENGFPVVGERVLLDLVVEMHRVK